jgi:hypothetical protein
MTSLNLAGNAIGGYRLHGEFIATPEGTAFSSVAFVCIHCLSYPCYSCCLSGPAAIADAINDMGARFGK